MTHASGRMCSSVSGMKGLADSGHVDLNAWEAQEGDLCKKTWESLMDSGVFEEIAQDGLFNGNHLPNIIRSGFLLRNWSAEVLVRNAIVEIDAQVPIVGYASSPDICSHLSCAKSSLDIFRVFV